MKLPGDVRSVDQVLAWLMGRLEPEDAFRLQQLVRDYETEMAAQWIALGRREVLIQIQCCPRN